MKFYLNDSDELTKVRKKDMICLYHSDWDDWFTFNTLYSIYYYDRDGYEIILGSVKIGQFNMIDNQRRPDLPSYFEKLGGNFFSLGQDSSYYENLSQISDNFRIQILDALNDIAFKPKLYQKALEENVTRISLLRDVSTTSVEGQFRKLASGNTELTAYKFRFHYPNAKRDVEQDIVLDFSVIPYSNPPSNIQVIIGRNGVGKTFLFDNMVTTLLDTHKQIEKNSYFSDNKNQLVDIFSNLVFVSFSSFDNINPRLEQKDKVENINYSYIGLKIINKENQSIRAKTPDEFTGEFTQSVEKCIIGTKTRRWLKALETLEADPIFKDAEVSLIAKSNFNSGLKEFAAKTFERLSSGHKIVLLTITRLVETLEEKSLVLLDEPETYLHPPLVSAFIRALSELLIQRNAVAIIGTHSPVVLQEVPSSCVWTLRRNGSNIKPDRLTIESFGENVGMLTQEVFGLEVTDSGFHNILKKLVEEFDTYEEAIKNIDKQLGLEGKAILRNLFYTKSRNEENRQTII